MVLVAGIADGLAVALNWLTFLLSDTEWLPIALDATKDKDESTSALLALEIKNWLVCALVLTEGFECTMN